MSTDTQHPDRPFVIRHLRIPESAGHFTPVAQLQITEALRTSGLLAKCSDEQAKVLLAMLTFMTPNGIIQVTANQLAKALEMPSNRTARILERFAQASPDQPTIIRIPRDTGPPVYTVCGDLITHMEAGDNTQYDVPPVSPPHSEDAITYTRARYARPRQAVERMVLTQLGHSPEEASDTPLGEARRGLVQLGVDRDTIDELIYTYPTEDILKQLAWLPERKARRPARFIVAAIEGNYGAPLAVRLRHAPSDAFVGTEDTVALPIPEQPEVDGVGREGHDA